MGAARLAVGVLYIKIRNTLTCKRLSESKKETLDRQFVNIRMDRLRSGSGTGAGSVEAMYG